MTKPENLSDKDRELAGSLAATCPEMTAVAKLTSVFVQLLRPAPENTVSRQTPPVRL